MDSSDSRTMILSFCVAVAFLSKETRTHVLSMPPDHATYKEAFISSARLRISRALSLHSSSYVLLKLLNVGMGKRDFTLTGIEMVPVLSRIVSCRFNILKRYEKFIMPGRPRLAIFDTSGKL